MPDPPPNLRIDRLTIRLPEGPGGHNRQSSSEIAHRTAEGLQGALGPASDDRHLGAANLRVRVPAGAATPELSAAIARAIARLLTP